MRERKNPELGTKRWNELTKDRNHQSTIKSVAGKEDSVPEKLRGVPQSAVCAVPGG